jgi:hypothetical protein
VLKYSRSCYHVDVISANHVLNQRLRMRFQRASMPCTHDIFRHPSSSRLLRECFKAVCKPTQATVHKPMPGTMYRAVGKPRSHAQLMHSPPLHTEHTLLVISCLLRFRSC